MSDDILDSPAFAVVNTRHLPYPPQRVFDAFADPDQLKVWWGPEGFTNQVTHCDFREGGELHITMINENERHFENTKRFIEIVAPERIVFQHLQPMHDFVMTITHEPTGGGTLLTWRMDFAAGQDAELAPFLHGANEQNFDRLEAFLNTN